MDKNVERARVHKWQLSLFPCSVGDVCRRMGLSRSGALRLYENGLLSFNPVTAGKLNDAQEAELKFFGYLLLAGCNMKMLKQLTRYLRKPYQYRLDLMYYDWLSQQWLLLPPMEEEEEEEEEEDPFEDWLDML